MKSIIVKNFQNKICSIKWRECYLYSFWMATLGIWSLFISGAIWLSLYCIVAATLVAITPLIFRLPIKIRKITLKFCSYGQLLLAGVCIVLLLALVPIPAYAQFLNGLDSWLKGVMPEIIHPALTLGINGLRAVFVYLGATKLSEAYRESRGEGAAEFMTLAREPIRGGLIIAITDVLILLYTGGATGGETEN